MDLNALLQLIRDSGHGLAVYAELDEEWGGRDAELEGVEYEMNGQNGSHEVIINVPLGDWARDRADFIMGLVRMTSSVGVGQLKRHWPGLSIETLRRDLKGLEAEGLLEAHGENRGRYYTLVEGGMEANQDVLVKEGSNGLQHGG